MIRIIAERIEGNLFINGTAFNFACHAPLSSTYWAHWYHERKKQEICHESNISLLENRNFGANDKHFQHRTQPKSLLETSTLFVTFFLAFFPGDRLVTHTFKVTHLLVISCNMAFGSSFTGPFPFLLASNFRHRSWTTIARSSLSFNSDLFNLLFPFPLQFGLLSFYSILPPFPAIFNFCLPPDAFFIYWGYAHRRIFTQTAPSKQKYSPHHKCSMVGYIHLENLNHIRLNPLILFILLFHCIIYLNFLTHPPITLSAFSVFIGV